MIKKIEITLTEVGGLCDGSEYRSWNCTSKPVYNVVWEEVFEDGMKRCSKYLCRYHTQVAVKELLRF